MPYAFLALAIFCSFISILLGHSLGVADKEVKKTKTPEAVPGTWSTNGYTPRKLDV